VGTLGRAQIWDVESDDNYVVDGHVTILRSNEQIVPEYLFSFLSSPLGQNQIKKYTKGATGQTELYKKHITDIELPLPPLDEQERIIEAVEERLNRVERLEKTVKNISKLSVEYQNSYLAYLITGGSEDAVENLGHKLTADDLPSGWKLKSVSEVVSAKNGGTPKTSEDKYWGGNIEWLSSGEIKGKYITSAKENINQRAINESSAKLFPKGSVLVAMYGSGTRGRSAIITNEMSGNQAICCLMPKEEILSEYLLYFYKSIEDRLASKARGAAQRNLNQSMVINEKIPVPPIDKQKDIVENIEKYNFDKIKKSSSLLSNYFVEYRDSVLAHAFSGDINY
jgi:type I restriction enzyme S subunit